SHLRHAGSLFFAGVREATAVFTRRGLNDPIARAWDSRVVVSVRRRVAQLRSQPGSRAELLRISLKEQAKVIESLAHRLSTSRDELEQLSHFVAQLEERLGAIAMKRAA